MSDPRFDLVVDSARTLLAEGATPTAKAVASHAQISLSTYYRLVGTHATLLHAAGHLDEPSSHERLIAAAASLLAEVGMSSLLMDDVAARAGVSRGTLYRLFPGKSHLFAALAESRSPLASLGVILKGMADVPPAEALPVLVQGIIPRLLENRGLLRAVLAEASVENAPGGDAARAVMQRLYGDLGDYMAGQMDAGRLRRTDPLIAVQSFLGPLLMYSVIRPDFWGDNITVADPPAVVAEFVDIWLRAMAPGSEAAT